MEFEIDRASVRHADRLKAPPVEGATIKGDKWVIRAESLDDLIALMGRTGTDIIVGPGPCGGLPRLTIYDDYVE